MMKIKIQSKTGDLNSTYTSAGDYSLQTIMVSLRRMGGYYGEKRGNKIFVPFEEIEYIIEDKE